MDDALVAHQLVVQYRAALAMLRTAIESCPESLWLDASYTNQFWQIAYHVVFYTHLYVQASEQEFRPWEHHRDRSNYLGSRAEAGQDPGTKITPYTRAQVLEYWTVCQDQVTQRVVHDNLAAQSGFSWLPFNRFEVHLYNLRHLAHHTGQLADRLRIGANAGVAWVRQG